MYASSSLPSWKFRTRSGIYSADGAKDKDDATEEQALLAVLETVRQHVGKSAGVSDTAFNSTFELFGPLPEQSVAVYTHGQYRGCGKDGTFGHARQVQEWATQKGKTRNRPQNESAKKKTQDNQNNDEIWNDDHHSPLPPEAYLHLRVEPMIRFYQSRM